MERLTYRTTKGEAMGNSSVADIGDILEKLAEYEDLEDKLNGVSVKQVVDGFINTVKNQTNEEYEHGRILTNAEADKWNEYKQLDEQGLLLRLPCKIGDVFFSTITNGSADKCKVSSITIKSDETFKIRLSSGYYRSVFEVTTDDIGKTVFLTKEEAEQALKQIGE